MSLTADHRTQAFIAEALRVAGSGDAEGSFRRSTVLVEELRAALVEAARLRVNAVLAMRTQGLTAAQISRKLGLSAARVSQLLRGAR